MKQVSVSTSAIYSSILPFSLFSLLLRYLLLVPHPCTLVRPLSHRDASVHLNNEGIKIHKTTNYLDSAAISPPSKTVNIAEDQTSVVMRLSEFFLAFVRAALAAGVFGVNPSKRQNPIEASRKKKKEKKSLPSWQADGRLLAACQADFVVSLHEMHSQFM